jgi:peptidoglycan/LPS O-acetylase OafA/YrhL
LLLGIVLLLIGLVLFVPIRPIFVAMEYCSPFVFTAAALFSSGLLLVALVSENAGSFVHGFFVNKTLAFFGFISYSLYLYHFILLRMLTYKTLLLRIDLWQHPLLTLYLMGVCALGFSVLLAWISRVTVERFALSKKAIFD